MLRTTATLIALSMASATYAADFKVKLAGGWNGKTVPAGQHCKLHGGKGKTPPMVISGLPEGTEWVLVEYNDRDYKPLSKRGGHGSIGYPVKGSSAKLPAVKANSSKLAGGAFVHKRAKSKGKYASKGYLPPCSGGAGNRYFADVHAMNGKKKKLGSARVELGKY
ncbi:hypothetical protein [Amylibacter sp. IMCC11727]|uniref:hypothetical protein n=1 Tax=Amylibacter sp. IMCC11727 TaxID=3039851 RepID=UPI00244DA655|nr:hypothetical protein [Amylibacter sp. IMCC11727]WGI20228.1 hypothetical protein QBD29_08820 [Amylibacter sp. IMCC11727]